METTNTATKSLTAAQKRVQDLEVKLKQAKALAQKQANKAKAREQTEARRLETRKKVLVGSWLLAGGDPLQFSNAAGITLDAWLTRPDEREIFGLAVQEKPVAEIKE